MMKKSGGQIWREGQAKVKTTMSNKGYTGVTGEAGVSCRAKVVEKEWGREIWMANNQEEDYCGKILQINQGYNTSLHFHLEKHETFYITKGQLQVDTICTLDGDKDDSYFKSRRYFVYRKRATSSTNSLRWRCRIHRNKHFSQRFRQLED